jgi:hypothetical protein
MAYFFAVKNFKRVAFEVVEFQGVDATGRLIHQIVF